MVRETNGQGDECVGRRVCKETSEEREVSVMVRERSECDGQGEE